MLEIWKDIKRYKGKYQISNLGRVKRLSRKITSKYFILKIGRDRTVEKILVNVKNGTGYVSVNLGDGVKMKMFSIHRLVAEHFIENKNEKSQVNHKNGIKDDNNIENLEWVTPSENGLHAYKKLRIVNGNKGKFGEKSNRHIVVLQKNLKNILVKKWDAMMDAQRAGFDSGCICHCCKGESKTHKGFIWEYDE